MNDQNIPEVTDDERRLARKWAAYIESNTDYRGDSSKDPWGDRVRAAAHVILRDIPAPPPPTLADMTDDERFNAVGMWAVVDGFHPYRAVIGDIPAPKVPMFRPTAGSLDWVHPEDVTPLPELGRAWSPGGRPTGTPAPAPAPALPEGWRLADHPQYGPVVVTSMEPDDAGFVWFVRTDPYGGSEGYDAGCCKPDVLTFLAQGADTSATEGVGTSDTVPESTLAVGSEWDDADALTRACEETGRDQIIVLDRAGGAYVWDEMAEWWEGSAPPRSAPYTILHAGKKADQ